MDEFDVKLPTYELLAKLWGDERQSHFEAISELE